MKKRSRHERREWDEYIKINKGVRHRDGEQKCVIIFSPRPADSRQRRRLFSYTIKACLSTNNEKQLNPYQNTAHLVLCAEHMRAVTPLGAVLSIHHTAKRPKFSTTQLKQTG